MQKQYSTAKKFKLITGVDLMKKNKELEKESKSDGDNMTDLMEFIQYGLHLAFYQPDLTKAKREFAEFKDTGMIESDIESLEKLSKKWSNEIKG